MKAVLLREFGGPENMYIGETEKPTLHDHPDYILVKIKAAGLNRSDCSQRMGHYPPPPGSSTILGLEMAGIVEEVGSNVKKWKQGDRVLSLLSGGGYAEYCIVHSEMAIEIPEDMSFEEAAGIPEAFLTAFQALFEIGKVEDNETIIIHAAASGVGISAIQLAVVCKTNVNVIVTARSEEKIKFCKELGAREGINIQNEPWLDKMNQLTSNKGVDFVLDFIGKDYFSQNLQILKMDGRLVILSFLSGPVVSEVDLSPILRKRLNIIGSTLRNRSLQYKINLTHQFYQFAWDAIRSKRISPIIDKVYHWEQISEAHQHMEENKNIGKIIINGM